MPGITSKGVKLVDWVLTDDARRQGDNELVSFLCCCLQVGQDLGHGVRYMSIAGTADVQYGSKGAARALTYLLGIGQATGAWERLKARDPDTFNRVERLRSRVEERDDFSEWYETGRDYVARKLELYRSLGKHPERR